MNADRTPARGTTTHRLAPCPERPNCVSTEATDRRHRMAPIPFAGEPALAMARLAAIVEAMPGGEVKHHDERSLHATFTTRLMRYVDDVDLVADPAAGVIRFRSASRTGHWDLGTNRRRMETIRRRFEKG